MHKLLTIPVCATAVSSSVCFYSGLFLRPVRCSQVFVGWSLNTVASYQTRQATGWESPYDLLVMFPIDHDLVTLCDT